MISELRRVRFRSHESLRWLCQTRGLYRDLWLASAINRRRSIELWCCCLIIRYGGSIAVSRQRRLYKITINQKCAHPLFKRRRGGSTEIPRVNSAASRRCCSR
jgi:hypothetical protein